DFSVDIGPDIVLCNPASATLDAGFTGPGVTYQWFLDGVAIAGATSQTYFLNTPGTYRVEVTDPACGMRSDEAIVTTNAAVPVNATYCIDGSTADVSVIGTGNYKWFDAAVGGTELAKGPNYTT